MKITNEIAETQELDAYLKKNKKYYEITSKQMKLLLLDKTMELHSFEELVFLKNDILYISPRGIDFFQEVILPGLLTMHTKQLKYNKTNYKKILNSLDEQWTDKWIRYFSNERLCLETYFLKSDIPLKEFYKRFKITSKKFNSLIFNHPEIKNIIYKRDGKRYIKQENVTKLMMNYFRDIAAKNISGWIYSQPESNNQKYYSIKIKEFPEMENQKIRKPRKDVKKIKIDKPNVKKPQLISVKSPYINVIGIAELEIIKKELHNWHPHEQMIYKVWDTEQNIAGELFFTMHGANWYTRIYKPIEHQKSDLFFHENEERYQLEKQWMEQLLKKENVDLETGLDQMPIKLRYMYKFENLEHMERVLKRIGIDKEVIQLRKEDYQKLEKEFPELQIRRYSYLYSKTKGYQESIVQYVNPVKIPKQNVEWLEIDTSDPGWYYGRIINRHYYYGKGKQEVLTLNVQLDNGKKIKLRYPQVINRQSAICLMYEAGVPIRFEVEKVKTEKEEHKRVKQIILYKQIGFILDWRQCEMMYVPVPQVGGSRKKIKEEDDIFKS